MKTAVPAPPAPIVRAGLQDACPGSGEAEALLGRHFAAAMRGAARRK